jgi:pyrimidine 5'-nucleotidase
MKFQLVFFDLDSTLYPEANGLWAAIRKRIDLYMRQRIGLPWEEIPKLRQAYFAQYGTTLKGLQANFNIDPANYLNFVHDLPLEAYLQPEPGLRQMLLSMPLRRWVFTNSDVDHAQRVLKILGVEDCFEGIIDVWAMEPYCKPQREAYQRALELAGSAGPQGCALIDDSHHNLSTARQLGFFTVLVGRNGAHPDADRALVDLIRLPDVVPEFWGDHGG